jgi:4-diphosphocytidyl-2-C-methyl-D-erythritol kinase
MRSGRGGRSTDGKGPMLRAPAPAKINLALVVGPCGDDGRHAVTTVLQRINLCDRITVRRASESSVDGFPGDHLVGAALRHLAEAAGGGSGWAVSIAKRIPVAAGLGGGSSDAATAIRLANQTLERPLAGAELHALAASLGADVPFFLAPGPQLGEGDGTRLSPLELPQDFWVVVVLPSSARKSATADVYASFDEHGSERGYESRRSTLLDTLADVRRPRDLARLPGNDLASSPLAAKLRELGAFRADVSGAGPAVYGLFHHLERARSAARAIRRVGRAWVTVPAWYG